QRIGLECLLVEIILLKHLFGLSLAEHESIPIEQTAQELAEFKTSIDIRKHQGLQQEIRWRVAEPIGTAPRHQSDVSPIASMHMCNMLSMSLQSFPSEFAGKSLGIEATFVVFRLTRPTHMSL